MATRKLDKENWGSFFDRVSAGLVGMQAEIEVDSLELGAQIEAEWLPVLGITYEPKDDMLEIALEGVDHLIHKPREIHVDEGIGGLASLLVVDGDGVKQIVKLREPLMLPSSSASAS
jgi:hypothetical protein